MKLALMLEKHHARNKTVIYYHGTGGSRLQRIMNHGLVYDDALTNTPNAEAETIYLTTNIDTALTYASMHSNDIGIIVVQIQPRTASMDEDKLQILINDLAKSSTDTNLAKFIEDEPRTLGSWLMRKLEELGVNPTPDRAKTLLDMATETVVYQLIDVKTWSKPVQFRNVVWQRHIHSPFNYYAVDCYEKRLQSLHTLSNALRQFSALKDDCRVPAPIYFSGANKIIGATRFMMDGDDLSILQDYNGLRFLRSVLENRITNRPKI